MFISSPAFVGVLLDSAKCNFVEVFKGTGWMPWHQEPKKDVVACDKPRGVGKRTVIRGFPNGGTQPQSCVVTRT
jgi:hypothetical protein